MSYGKDGPLGLVAVNAMTCAPYNAQTTDAQIRPGYDRNIFRGDMVYIGADGYLHNLGDRASFATDPSWGVFAGCSYIQPSAANPADPASPGRPFWPAGTQTVNNSPVTGYYIIDSAVYYSLQSDAGGVGFADVGSTASISFTSTVATFPLGNLLTGNSSFVLNSATIAAPGTAPVAPAVLPSLNVKIVGFDKTPGNPIPIPGGPRVPFVNVIVVIQNHAMAIRNN